MTTTITFNHVGKGKGQKEGTVRPREECFTNGRRGSNVRTYQKSRTLTFFLYFEERHTHKVKGFSLETKWNEPSVRVETLVSDTYLSSRETPISTPVY